MFFKRKASQAPPSKDENAASSSQAPIEPTKQPTPTEEQTQPLPDELRMRRLALLQQRLGTIKKMEEDAAKRRAEVRREFEIIEERQRGVRRSLDSALGRWKKEKVEEGKEREEGSEKHEEKEEEEEERGRTRKRRGE